MSAQYLRSLNSISSSARTAGPDGLSLAVGFPLKSGWSCFCSSGVNGFATAKAALSEAFNGCNLERCF